MFDIKEMYDSLRKKKNNYDNRIDVENFKLSRNEIAETNCFSAVKISEKYNEPNEVTHSERICRNLVYYGFHM